MIYYSIQYNTSLYYIMLFTNTMMLLSRHRNDGRTWALKMDPALWKLDAGTVIEFCQSGQLWSTNI